MRRGSIVHARSSAAAGENDMLVLVWHSELSLRGRSSGVTASCTVRSFIRAAHGQVSPWLSRGELPPDATMRVCPLSVILAPGLGDAAQEVSQIHRLFSARRWTDGAVKEKVLCCTVCQHYFACTVSPVFRRGRILSCLKDVAGGHSLPAV